MRQESLAAERTVLAWDRTALALLGNGALLLVRDVRTTGPLALAAAAVALVAALVVAVLGRRRARSLSRPESTTSAAVRPLTVAGGAVTAVGVAVVVVLLIRAR